MNKVNTVRESDAHLNATTVLGSVRIDDRPRRGVTLVRPRDADAHVAEHAREELERRELDGVDADVVAQLDDDELAWRGARREHVPVPLRAQDAARAARELVLGVHARGAVRRREVEAVRERDEEVRAEVRVVRGREGDLVGWGRGDGQC
jgi:hypothetical protein